MGYIYFFCSLNPKIHIKLEKKRNNNKNTAGTRTNENKAMQNLLSDKL